MELKKNHNQCWANGNLAADIDDERQADQEQPGGNMKQHQMISKQLHRGQFGGGLTDEVGYA